MALGADGPDCGEGGGEIAARSRRCERRARIASARDRRGTRRLSTLASPTRPLPR